MIVHVSAGSSLVMSPPFVLTEAEAGQLIESVGTLLRRVQRSQPAT
ncbi:MAG: hypothetical protein KAH46_16125 [Mycobacterium sp.]|jgi:adenosylmethionine-8-amino-7-oxononanoate aminotransferase|nr:hypothetical protein [Mycobacterium sp.]QFS89408.1 hypothetical protein FIV07_01555 [Mycobacterium sp. THAF192]